MGTFGSILGGGLDGFGAEVECLPPIWGHNNWPDTSTERLVLPKSRSSASVPSVPGRAELVAAFSARIATCYAAAAPNTRVNAMRALHSVTNFVRDTNQVMTLAAELLCAPRVLGMGTTKKSLAFLWIDLGLDEKTLVFDVNAAGGGDGSFELRPPPIAKPGWGKLNAIHEVWTHPALAASASAFTPAAVCRRCQRALPPSGAPCFRCGGSDLKRKASEYGIQGLKKTAKAKKRR